MINASLILVITHSPSGQSLVSALRDILPSNLTEAILTIDIHIQDNPTQKIDDIKKALLSHSATQVLILTDLIGATPYNIARQVMNDVGDKRCALITGVNLPMLVKATNYQTLSLESWVAHVTDSALEWIIIEFSRKNA